MTRVGTGYVSIEPDFDTFDAKVRARLSALDGDFKRVGQSAGQGFTAGFNAGRASREWDTLRGKVSDTDKAARRATKGFEGLVSAAGGGGGLRNAARNLDAFGGAAGGATATIGGFRIAVAGLIPVMIGFGGASVAAASSLGPLIGLLAAGGNAFAAAAQGMGVFKLATMGVADALKEQTDKTTKSAGAAVSNASQQRSAARAVQSAQDGVRSATEGLARAQEAARASQAALSQARTDARRALVDMRQSLADAIVTEERAILSLRSAKDELERTIAGATAKDVEAAQVAVTGAALDQEQAVLNLTRAQENLARVNADATATATDRQQALLDVAKAQETLTASQRSGRDAQEALDKLRAGPSEQERATAVLNVVDAEQALISARRDRARQEKDTAAAEAAGVTGAQQMVAAQKAVADANRGVQEAQLAVTRASQALRDAQLAAKDSMDKAGISAANLNQKFDKLPPAAKEFVLALKAMKPQLDALRQTAAAGFFPGATEGLRAAAKNFDSVNKVVGQTANVLGEAARKSGELVGSPAFGRDIETIGGRNAKVLDTLGEALRHVVSALRYVALAAGPLTQHLADLVLGWTKTAASAAKAGEESGRLAGFFEKTRAITERLLSVLGHLGSGLLGVGKAGKETGDGIWASIDRAAKRFDEWANSARGQTALRDFFRESKDLAAALVPVLGGVTQGIGFLTLKVLPLETALKVLGPYADEATAAFIAWKLAAIGMGVASSVATAITALKDAQIALKIQVILSTGALAAQKVAMIAGAAATATLTAAQWLLNAALTANPIGIVVVALAAIVAGFIYAYNHSETFRKAVDDLWDTIKTVFNWIKDNWPLIIGIIGGPIGVVVAIVTTSWDTIRNVTTTVWTAISTTLSTVWGTIRTVASTAWEGIKSAVTNPIGAARDVLSAVWGTISSAASTAWSGISAAASAAWEAIRGAILTPIRSARDVLGDVWGAIRGAATDAWKAIRDGVGDLASGIKDAVVSGVRGGLNELIGFLNDVIDAINLLPIVDIGHIKKIPEQKAPDSAGPGKKPGGFARGGAFARTGGIVDHPMVLMGEEAPQFAEFVIPTNPAYRDRARDLLMQAWGTIGFASGGVYSKGELAALWRRVNPGLGDPNLMAAIALAESGGQSNIVNSIGAGGLWQIYPPESGYLNPETNARIAGRKLQTQGLRAWEAYTNGSYRQFLHGSGGGGVLGKVTGFVGDLLSKGAGLILDKLPGVGGLPDWLRGLGGHLLAQVGSWVKDKVSDLIGLGGGDGAPGGGVTGSIQGAMALAREMGLRITSTTGGQHAANSWHYKGRAADVAGSPAQMAAFYRAALGRYDGRLLELFYDPLGAIKNGHPIPAIGGHSDHVHIALARGGLLGGEPEFGGSFAGGGIVPGPMGAPRLIEAHGGEVVTDPRVGPLVHVDQLVVADRSDVNTVAARLAWLIEQA